MIRLAVRFSKPWEHPCPGYPLLVYETDSELIPIGYDCFMTQQEIDGLKEQYAPQMEAWKLSNKENEWNMVRNQRNELLSQTDWVEFQTLSLQINSNYQKRISYLIYRQKLRDITYQEDPYNVVYPILPTEQLILTSAPSSTDQTNIDAWVNIIWWSTYYYQFARIEATAAGPINLKAALQGKPKCQALCDWTNGLWYKYSVEKAKLQAGLEANFDMSSHGELPYSVWEALTE